MNCIQLKFSGVYIQESQKANENFLPVGHSQTTLRVKLTNDEAGQDEAAAVDVFGPIENDLLSDDGYVIEIAHKGDGYRSSRNIVTSGQSFSYHSEKLNPGQADFLENLVNGLAHVEPLIKQIALSIVKSKKAE